MRLRKLCREVERNAERRELIRRIYDRVLPQEGE